MANTQSHNDAVARVPRALAFRHDALPLAVDDGVLAIGLADPDDAAIVDALRAATRLRVRAVAMPRAVIRERLRDAYGDAPAADALSDVPAVRAVDRVLEQAIAAHASDVHVEPGARDGRVRIRVDGVLRDLDAIPAELLAAFVSRVKILAGMDVADRRTPQDGRFAIPFERRAIDARVASVPTLDGEKLVIRLLDRYASLPELASLGLPPALLERYRAIVRAPFGFVVVAGPTGSGKTTTLYASLAALDAASRNVCAVEDPVEMRLQGVTQVQVNAKAGLSFPRVLRAFMRQDPNVVMVGEMRDGETAAVAVSAALAGQIVFTTLHANDAPRAIDRLVELGVARHALAAALTGVVAQRLVRVLCERCRAREPVPDALRDALAAAGGAGAGWYVAHGCRACSGSGFIGRTGVYELLAVDDAVRDAVAGGASSVHVAALAERAGYAPMRDDGLRKVAAGITAFGELARVVAWDGPR